MAELKSTDVISSETQFNSAQYKETYMQSRVYFQNQNFKSAIAGFMELVKADATNDLADNSKYWLAYSYPINIYVFQNN